MRDLQLDEMKFQTSPKTLYVLGGILVGVTLWVAKIDFTQASQGKQLSEVQGGLIKTDDDRIMQREKMMSIMNRIDNRLSRIEGKLGIPQARE